LVSGQVFVNKTKRFVDAAIRSTITTHIDPVNRGNP